MTRCALYLSLRQSAFWRSVDVSSARSEHRVGLRSARRSGRALPDLDAKVIHLGGARALGVLVTMDDQQAADMVALISPPSPSIY